MATAEVKIELDAHDIERIEKAMQAAGKRSHDAIRRAVNWTGDRTKTRVVRALTKQTGLKAKTIGRAVRPTRANYSALVYRMRAAGGDVALKYFGARETQAGVTAAPWGERKLYPHTFTRGGLFPRRVTIAKLHGQVFKRAGGSRLPIEKVKSGLYIPAEMIKGETAHAFEAAVASLMPARVEHEVGAILSGATR